LLGFFGLVVAFSSCGPLSSRDKPGTGGTDASSAGTEPGAGSEARAGRGGGTNGAGTTGDAIGGASNSPGGAPSELAGAAGMLGDAGAGGVAEPVGPVTIATGQITPTGIAIDSSYVYWANRDAGTIVKCPRNGCGSSKPTVIGSAVGAPLGVTVDATNVYWINAVVTVNGVPTGRIFKCPLSGCAPTPIQLTEFQVNNRTNGLHVAGDTLYYAAWPQLGTCPIGGCAAPTSIGGGPFLSVVTDAAFLYAGEYGVGYLVRCPLTGCNSGSVTLATQVHALAVAVDATDVYFANHDYFTMPAATTHDIEKCPLAGCGATAPKIVQAGDISPYGLAVNATRLYFTNVAQGTVVSVPK
jgi:hypothetical protein